MPAHLPAAPAARGKKWCGQPDSYGGWAGSHGITTYTQASRASRVPNSFDQNTLPKAINIVATTGGLNAVAARKQAKVATTQINIINSTVGQLALRDISNVDISVILDAVERSLETRRVARV